MSHNTTTTPETLREPLVIPLSQPLQPGSAVERWLWDMFVRGLVDVSTSDRIPQGGDTAPSRNRRTPAGADVSSSDSGETTAYSTDMAFSEDTTYSSDSIHEVAGKGVSIAAGTNEGGSYTLGKRIALEVPPVIRLRSQRYLIQIVITNQPVADLEEFGGRYGKFLKEAIYMLDLDNGSNTTWFLGYNCQELLLSDSDSTVRGGTTYSIRPWPTVASDTEPQSLGERAMIYDHAYVRGSNVPDPNRPTTGMIKYADRTAAAVLLHDKALKMTIDCYNWSEKSWKGSVSLDYKPAVAYGVTNQFCCRPMSGILALGPMRHQSAFGDAVNRFQAPAFLEALRNKLPPISGGGTIVYFVIRPPALYEGTKTGYRLLDREAEHWISLNGWPCELPPAWSQPIYLVPEGKYWKVRLLSMTFQRFNKDKQAYEPFDDPDSGTITFGDDGLLVHLDCGASISIVPPSLVRHIRTKLLPTPKNKKMDAEYQDAPCSISTPVVPFYVPDSGFMTIIYKFADGRGNEVEVTGPSNHFFSQPNPYNHSHSKDKEGLIFVGPPDVIRGEAIFGLNFFYSMFVALHNPHRGDPYVKLAPQWDTQMVQFSPRHEVD